MNAVAPVPAPPPTALLKAARRMLRPFVRLAIRSGVTFPVLGELLRTLYVEVATQDLLTDVKVQTDSRISLLTGVHRKEIRRLRKLPPGSEAVPEVVTIGSQIVARWLGGAAYQDTSGQPVPLPRAPQPNMAVSFEGLVESVTTDVRPRAVLDDWLSQNLVTLDESDVVHLNTAAFIPRPGGEAQLFYFARNLHDHVAAATANLTAAAPPFIDRSVHYDRLSPEVARQLQEAARAAAARVLVEVNRLAIELTEGEPDPAAVTVDSTATKRVNFGVYVYTGDEIPSEESSS